MGQVAQADGVEPEHVVQRVVQAGGDQQAVEEGVQAGTDAAQAHDAVAQRNQGVEDQRPQEQQDDGRHDGNQAGDDGHAAFAAEEGQPVRQLGVLELVVAGGADDGSQDADEGVAGSLLESNEGGRVFLQRHKGQGADNTSGEQLGHHQVADQASQGGRTVMVVRQAHGRADGEQPGHVVDQRTAGFDQDKADGVGKTFGRTFSTHSGRSQGVAQTHQDAADGQRGNGQHKRLAELLQIFHHKSIPPNIKWIPCNVAAHRPGPRRQSLCCFYVNIIFIKNKVILHKKAVKRPDLANSRKMTKIFG